MASHEGIRHSADLEELVRALVRETIAAEDKAETRGLRGARVLYPGETIDPSFLIRLPDGRQFEVIIRELD